MTHRNRLLVHIGTRKTGTTSIQQALARAEWSRDLRPIRYPLPDGNVSHARLAKLYLPQERVLPLMRDRFPADESRRIRYLPRLYSQLGKTDRAIISSEMLEDWSVSEVHRLRRDLQNVGFTEFRVVLYVRDPADYYLSRMQQILKVSSRVVDPVSFRYQFRCIAETWEEAFPGCLTVRPFSNEVNFDVVQDFFRLAEDFLGAPLRAGSGDDQVSARANTTVSSESMEILQRYRSAFWSHRDFGYISDGVRLVKVLQHSWTVVPQTRPRLKPEIAAWIRANHRDDLALIAERYGVDLPMDSAGEPLEPLETNENPPVADLLQCVDRETVTELLLWIVKEGLDQNLPIRALPTRIAIRLAKRTLPPRITSRLARMIRA